MNHTRTYIALALSATLLSGGPSSAAPVSMTASSPIATTITKDLQSVGYRGYRGGRYGRNIGLGIAAGIIGGVVISQAGRANGYSERRYRASGSSAAQHCADTYRSFDWNSGTYMGYDGERHVCPYLR